MGKCRAAAETLTVLIRISTKARTIAERLFTVISSGRRDTTDSEQLVDNCYKPPQEQSMPGPEKRNALIFHKPFKKYYPHSDMA